MSGGSVTGGGGGKATTVVFGVVAVLVVQLWPQLVQPWEGLVEVLELIVV